MRYYPWFREKKHIKNHKHQCCQFCSIQLHFSEIFLDVSHGLTFDDDIVKVFCGHKFDGLKYLRYLVEKLKSRKI